MILHTTTYGDSGSRVVFCHGLFGQGRNWTRFAKALAADHRVLLVDMPNHGRSAWTEGFDYVEAAEQVAALLDPDDPVALVGHSMGGKIAMLVALLHPDLVERLCVVDISPVAHDGSTEFARYIEAMLAIDLDRLETRQQADEALLDAVPDPTVRGFLLQNLRRDGDSWMWQPNLRLLGESLDELGGWPTDAVESLPSYDGTVVWVGGARSPYITESGVAAMDRYFPRNRRVTVKGAGHWVHSEQPEIFGEILRRFLGRRAH